MENNDQLVTRKLHLPFVNRIYGWFIKWAQKPNSERALAGFSIIEAIFFPIPPDPLLIAMIFSKYDRWVRLVSITLISSIIGGVIGYFFGVVLFESIGQWIINQFDMQQGYESLGIKYSQGAFIVILTAAFTPVPYKLITISAGAFAINFWIFLLASIIGRGLRFAGVGYMARYLGKRHKDKIEKYINVISLIVIALLIISFLLVRL